MKGVLDSIGLAANGKESRLCAHPYPTQNKVLTAFHSALNMCHSKKIMLSHIVYSPLTFAAGWNPKQFPYRKYLVVFIIQLHNHC